MQKKYRFKKLKIAIIEKRKGKKKRQQKRENRENKRKLLRTAKAQPRDRGL